MSSLKFSTFLFFCAGHYHIFFHSGPQNNNNNRNFIICNGKDDDIDEPLPRQSYVSVSEAAETTRWLIPSEIRSNRTIQGLGTIWIWHSIELEIFVTSWDFFRVSLVWFAASSICAVLLLSRLRGGGWHSVWNRTGISSMLLGNSLARYYRSWTVDWNHSWHSRCVFIFP